MLKQCDDVQVGDNLAWYLSLCDDGLAEKVVAMLPDTFGVKDLKQISDFVKPLGSEWDPFWEQAINLELFYGFSKEERDDTYVRSWLGETKDPGWHAHIDVALQRLMAQLGPISQIKTVAEFIDDPALWGTGGAGPKGDGVAIGGKLPKTKLVWGLTTSLKKRLSTIWNSAAPELKVIDKKERGPKRRLITTLFGNASMGDYLRQAFFGWHFKQSLSKWPGSWLYASPRSMAARVSQLASYAGFGWNVPFDFQNFDFQVTRRLRHAVLFALYEHSQLNEPELFRLMMQGMDETWINYHDLRFKLRDGLPSGWWFTALLGTLCNWVMIECIMISSGLKPSYRLHQGDDAAIVFTLEADCRSFLAKAAELGIKYNRSKNYIAKGRTEFLRYTFTSRRVFGYPARVAATLLYKREVERPGTRLQIARERASNWLLLESRLGKVVRDMDVDLFGLLGQVADSFIHSYIGGAGVEPVTGTSIKERTRKGTLVAVKGGIDPLVDEYLASIITEKVPFSVVITKGRDMTPGRESEGGMDKPKWLEGFDTATWGLRRQVMAVEDIVAQLDARSLLLFREVAKRWRRSVVIEWLRGRDVSPLHLRGGEVEWVSKWGALWKPDLFGALRYKRFVTIGDLERTSFALARIWLRKAKQFVLEVRA